MICSLYIDDGKHHAYGSDEFPRARIGSFSECLKIARDQSSNWVMTTRRTTHNGPDQIVYIACTASPSFAVLSLWLGLSEGNLKGDSNAHTKPHHPSQARAQLGECDAHPD